MNGFYERIERSVVMHFEEQNPLLASAMDCEERFADHFTIHILFVWTVGVYGREKVITGSFVRKKEECSF